MQLSRRHALMGFVTGLATVSLDWLLGTAPASAADGTCVLWPQLDEGPYYFDTKLVRADITEGRPGAPLKLNLLVVESGPCKPMAGIRVDVWHADAGGIYSGYSGQGDKRDTSTRGEKYLRGTQVTDASGAVVFNTIYPGWYPGRTPHIHVKAFLADKMVVTGQAFFPDEFSAKVYREKAPYSVRPVPDTTNKTDGIYQDGQTEGGGTVLAMAEEVGVIQARLTISIDQTGDTAGKAEGWGHYFMRLLGRA